MFPILEEEWGMEVPRLSVNSIGNMVTLFKKCYYRFDLNFLVFNNNNESHLQQNWKLSQQLICYGANLALSLTHWIYPC